MKKLDHPNVVKLVEVVDDPEEVELELSLLRKYFTQYAGWRLSMQKSLYENVLEGS